MSSSRIFTWAFCDCRSSAQPGINPGFLKRIVIILTSRIPAGLQGYPQKLKLIWMRLKIIVDYWLSYLNDLLGIKLICLRSKLNVELSEFVWTLRSSVLVVFNNFLLIDATDRSKISSDQKRFFIALSLYPLSFFANTPFNNNLRISTA